MKNKDLNILFIGNSHTYFNDMPLLVKRRADDEGFNCRVTMLAHPKPCTNRDTISNCPP